MAEDPNAARRWAATKPSPLQREAIENAMRAASPPRETSPSDVPLKPALRAIPSKQVLPARPNRKESVQIIEVPKELKDKERVQTSKSDGDHLAAIRASASLEKAVSELEVARNVERVSSLVNVAAPPPDDHDLKVPGGDLDLDLLRRLHWRFLEGYRCWTDHVHIRNVAADPTAATTVERFREILLWKVLVSLAEAGSFSSEHLCVNFHRTLLGANTRPDGSSDRPYVLDLSSLHRGLQQVNRGEINIDDMTYSALHPTSDLLRPQQPMKDTGTRHYADVDSYRIYFQWSGSDAAMSYLFRTHIDTQARNLERMLGRYVPRKVIIQRHAPSDKKDEDKHKEELEEKAAKPQLLPVAAPSYDKFFHSPKGAGVVFLVLCNYFSYLVYKVWAFVFALAIANNWGSEHYFDSLARADGICIIIQAVVEIGCRAMLYRKRFFSSFPFNSVVTAFVILCQIVLVCAGTFMVTGKAKGIFSARVDVPHRLGKMKLLFDNDQLLINLPLIYLLARIGAFVLYNAYLWLSFTPLIEGSARTQFSLWGAIKRKMRFRTFATLLYWGITLAVCAVFEVKVLVPSVSVLTPAGTCGCNSFKTCTYQASLQCLLTIGVVWLLVFINFIIDTHVVFVGLLSIIGLFVGVGSRLRPQDLFQLRVEPFSVVNQLKSKFLPPNADVRLGMRVWDTIIEEMYDADLISDGHCKQLKLMDRIPDEDWSIELPVFEAQERLSFFINSLAMKSAPAPSIPTLQSVSTIVPCYDENIVFSYDELCRPHYYGGKPGPTDIENLISVYPLEWEYFTSRMKAKGYIAYNWTPQHLFEEFIKKRLVPDSILVDKIRLWASFRGQTVARTIRGITYYEKVLGELGCDHKTRKRKFQVLLSLQTYTSYDAIKLNGVNLLLREFPHVEIVYEWDREAAAKPFLRPHVEKLTFLDEQGVHFAIVKEEWNIREQRLEVTEVLPRTMPLLLGPEGERLQGKALNQRNALMFAWAEVLQTLDANQDGTFEDALKIPSLLQYFHSKNGHGLPDLKALGPPRYRIIGFREAIFTSGLTTVGRYMALADFSFTTIFSRVLANPLSVRMHYGHPDFFDACWVMSRGALCKASPKINLNEDIFAGYTATLRNQRITHKEFIQMRKGREISLKLADQFDAKLAEGAAAQMRSSDLFELNQRLNFVKKISMFHGSIGFYIIMCIMAYSITLYVLAVLLFAISGVSLSQLADLGSIYSTEFVIALGFIYMLPGVVEQFIQFGPKTLISILLNFVPSSLFFGFLLQTKAHNFLSSLVTGKAQYRATGRKLTIEHWTLKDLFISYSDSHFTAGARLLFLIALYHFVALHNIKYIGVLPLITPTILAFTWILCPILFNPFPSYEGYSKDAKEVWHWLTRPKDLDLCALSYLHPKGDKKLGVPPQRDVEQDGWANWYVISHCNALANKLQRKRGIFFLLLKQTLFLAALAIFVLGMTPTSLLCTVYLCLLGFLLLFALGIRKMLRYFAYKGGHGAETLSSVFSILTVAACLALVIYFVLITPIAAASTFLFVDFAVAALVIVFVLRFIRDSVYLIFGFYLHKRPKQFVSVVSYMSSGTLQMKIAWIAAVGVVLLQVVFGYFLSIFPQLHTTFLFNPNLTTTTHGLDNLPRGTLRKLEMGAAPKIAALNRA